MRSAPTSSERPTVLIVDDNADKLIALESILLSLHVDLVKARRAAVRIEVRADEARAAWRKSLPRR